MKKTLILSLLALMPTLASAFIVEIDGISYNLISEAKGAEVIRSTSYYGHNVVIPSSVTYEGVEYNVTSIGEDAFYECWGLTSISIPNTVISIGYDAFYNCIYLTSVNISDIAAWCSIHFTGINSNPLTYAHRLYLNDEEITNLTIPDGVTTIGNSSFSGCTGLTSVTIPDCLTSIGNSAFIDCTGLISVKITDITSWYSIKFKDKNSNPLAYAHRLYLNDEEITDLTIPDGVTTIENSAFIGCTSLTSVTIPKSVTSIGEYAFYGCTGLSSFIIPNSVTTIGGYAFYDCTGLTSVTIPNSVTTIGEYAFYGCTGLNSVKISDIAAWCSIYFINYCSNPLTSAHRLYLNDEEITDLTIPDGVTTIENLAFIGYTSLTSVTIPNSVTYIGESAFYDCTGLTSVTIPNSVTYIGGYAFYDCTGLTSVTIPNSVTTIGGYAFYKCESLSSASLSNSLTAIERYAFSYCTSLTSIAIPNSVTSIKEHAFYHCGSLDSVTIGSAVMNIEDYAFAFCPELTDVFCFATNVPSTSTLVFLGSYIEYATLHVPANAIEDYRKRGAWSRFRNIVEVETPDLPKCATPTIFYQNGELTFSSETEGVDFVIEIDDSDIRTHHNAKISLSATYNIHVYAMKNGYENSDVAYATLCWIEAEPKTEGIEDGIAQIPVRPVMIQMRDGEIIVTGAKDEQQIVAFSTEGHMLGQSISHDGSAVIPTNLQHGAIAIVKIGDKTVRIMEK